LNFRDCSTEKTISMNRRRILAIAIGIVLALVGLAWWALRSSRVDSALIRRDELQTAQHSVATDELVAPADARSAPRETVSAEPVSAPDETAAKTAETATLTLEGTLVVIDAEGGEHRSESGTFVLSLFGAEHGVGYDVDVHDGRWSCPLHATEGWSC